MMRTTAFAIALGIMLLAVTISPQAPGGANAATSGPAIVAGAPSGTVVPVNAQTAPAAPYNAFNLHVSATAGAGVTLSGMTGSGTGNTLDGGSNGVFCATQAPATNELTFGCVTLDGLAGGTGLLAHITVQATGNGCVTVRLMDLPDADPNAAASDTYTAEQSGTSEVRQQNVVGAGSVNVFVGAGTLADCVDSDGDGCTNAQEAGPNHLFGGDRDASNPWDFADMWTPALPATAATRTKAVNISDVIAVLSWIGAANNSIPNINGNDYDSDTNFNGIEDGAEYDRSVSSDLAKPWRSGAPSGSVAIADAIVMLSQIGDHC